MTQPGLPPQQPPVATDRHMDLPGRSAYRQRDAVRASARRPGPPAGTGAQRAAAGERLTPLPGDDLVPSSMAQTTHAVTINVPPQQTWPWLVQTGQGRPGFYSDSRFFEPVRGLVLPSAAQDHSRPGITSPPATGSSRLGRTRRWGTSSRAGPPGTACYAGAGRTRQTLRPAHRHTSAVPAARTAAWQPPAWHTRRAQRPHQADRTRTPPLPRSGDGQQHQPRIRPHADHSDLHTSASE